MSETFTNKLKLSKRDSGDLNWAEGANANLDLVDAHAQQLSLRPPRTLLASLGAGGVGGNLLGNTTYFYKITAINDAGETTENLVPSVLEAQITEPVTPVPVVLQWETISGASGYRIYKSTATGVEEFLVEKTGGAISTHTDDGNTAVQTSNFVPTSNTAFTSVSKIIPGTNVTVTPSHGKGDVQIDVSGGGGVTSLRKTGEAGGLTGDVELEEGTGLSLTQNGPGNKINLANAGVTGLRKTGEASFLDGGVELEEGSGVTLTQDGPSKKITIAAAGGGGGGVAAPTGVAATDTAAIAAALSAAASAGGGIVQLQVGTYNINATLNIGTSVTLQGMGRAATILLADPIMGASSIISSSGFDNGLRDLTVDENQPNRAGGSPFSGCLMNSQRVLIENCKFTRNKSTGSFVFIGGGPPGNGGMMRNCIVDNNGNALSTAIVQGGELIDSCLLSQNQSGNVNDFMQSPSQVLNCRLLKNSGTLSGAGIRAQTNAVIMGNGIFTGSGNNAILVNGNASSFIGNVCQAGNITLNSGAANNTIIGNVSATIVDNSGQSNVIANNS